MSAKPRACVLINLLRGLSSHRPPAPTGSWIRYLGSTGSETPQPIESPAQLVDFFASGGKSRERWRLGTEHELIGVSIAEGDAGQAPPYEGDSGIAAVLQRFQSDGWRPVSEGDSTIGLVCDDAQVTIEPGGQFELAGRPVFAFSDAEAEIRAFHRRLAHHSRELQVAWLGLGFRPFGTRADVPWMPKGRYRVMREYLPTRGALAHEMMLRTATVQVNLDFSDEADAARKLRCAHSITSILTAMYANSPIVDGAVAPYQSYRAHVWQATDPDRCGLLPFVFEQGDVFRSYCDWALDAPMFFVHRGAYLPANGMTFRSFVRDGFHGHTANVDDWELHLSTLFPEARMKRFIEIRGCDCGPLPMVLSLAPLCRGVFYDDLACQHATSLTSKLSFGDRVALWDAVSRRGLHAAIPSGHTVLELARELVQIAADGLRRQAPEELGYLEPLRQIVETGRTLADDLVETWRRLNGDVASVVRQLAVA